MIRSASSRSRSRIRHHRHDSCSTAAAAEGHALLATFLLSNYRSSALPRISSRYMSTGSTGTSKDMLAADRKRVKDVLRSSKQGRESIASSAVEVSSLPAAARPPPSPRRKNGPLIRKQEEAAIPSLLASLRTLHDLSPSASATSLLDQLRTTAWNSAAMDGNADHKDREILREKNEDELDAAVDFTQSFSAATPSLTSVPTSLLAISAASSSSTSPTPSSLLLHHHQQQQRNSYNYSANRPNPHVLTALLLQAVFLGASALGLLRRKRDFTATAVVVASSATTAASSGADGKGTMDMEGKEKDGKMERERIAVNLLLSSFAVPLHPPPSHPTIAVLSSSPLELAVDRMKSSRGRSKEELRAIAFVLARYGSPQTAASTSISAALALSARTAASKAVVGVEREVEEEEFLDMEKRPARRSEKEKEEEMIDGMQREREREVDVRTAPDRWTVMAVLAFISPPSPLLAPIPHTPSSISLPLSMTAPLSASTITTSCSATTHASPSTSPVQTTSSKELVSTSDAMPSRPMASSSSSSSSSLHKEPQRYQQQKEQEEEKESKSPFELARPILALWAWRTFLLLPPSCTCSFTPPGKRLSVIDTQQQDNTITASFLALLDPHSPQYITFDSLLCEELWNDLVRILLAPSAGLDLTVVNGNGNATATGDGEEAALLLTLGRIALHRQSFDVLFALLAPSPLPFPSPTALSSAASQSTISLETEQQPILRAKERIILCGLTIEAFAADEEWRGNGEIVLALAQRFAEAVKEAVATSSPSPSRLDSSGDSMLHRLELKQKQRKGSASQQLRNVVLEQNEVQLVQEAVMHLLHGFGSDLAMEKCATEIVLSLLLPPSPSPSAVALSHSSSSASTSSTAASSSFTPPAVAPAAASSIIFSSSFLLQILTSLVRSRNPKLAHCIFVALPLQQRSLSLYNALLKSHHRSTSDLVWAELRSRASSPSPVGVKGEKRKAGDGLKPLLPDRTSFEARMSSHASRDDLEGARDDLRMMRQAGLRHDGPELISTSTTRTTCVAGACDAASRNVETMIDQLEGSPSAISSNKVENQLLSILARVGTDRQWTRELRRRKERGIALDSFALRIIGMREFALKDRRRSSRDIASRVGDASRRGEMVWPSSRMNSGNERATGEARSGSRRTGSKQLHSMRDRMERAKRSGEQGLTTGKEGDTLVLKAVTRWTREVGVEKMVGLAKMVLGVEIDREELPALKSAERAEERVENVQVLVQEFDRFRRPAYRILMKGMRNRGEPGRRNRLISEMNREARELRRAVSEGKERGNVESQ